MTYRERDLRSRGASRDRVGAAVSGGVVNLSEAEALVVVVGDGEALDQVRELADDIQERLRLGLEEGGVPRAGTAGKLVAFLQRWLVVGVTPKCQPGGYVPLRYTPKSLYPP